MKRLFSHLKQDYFATLLTKSAFLKDLLVLLIVKYFVLELLILLVYISFVRTDSSHIKTARTILILV